MLRFLHFYVTIPGRVDLAVTKIAVELGTFCRATIISIKDVRALQTGVSETENLSR